MEDLRRKTALHQLLETKFTNLSENIFLEREAAFIEQALLDLASEAAVRAEVPGLGHYLRDYASTQEAGDASTLEGALLNLYIRLHTAGSGYSPAERETLEGIHGCTCQPGGLSPLIMARPFIRPDSIRD